MDDLALRVKRCTRHLTDSSLPKYKRVVRGLKVFQGLELTILDARIKTELEQSLLQVNQILHPYQFERYEDYRQISEDDLKQVLQIKMRMCMKIKKMNQLT